MILDIDFLIDFFNKISVTGTKDEMGEQEDSAPASTGGGGSSSGGGSVPKWADSYPITRGKANRLGASGEKWETGLTRGAANQIW
jgi:hypothetical protein